MIIYFFDFYLGRRAVSAFNLDDKSRNRLKEDSKSDFNKYNYKRRGKGLTTGNYSYDPSGTTVIKKMFLH